MHSVIITTRTEEIETPPHTANFVLRLRIEGLHLSIVAQDYRREDIFTLSITEELAVLLLEHQLKNKSIEGEVFLGRRRKKSEKQVLMVLHLDYPRYYRVPDELKRFITNRIQPVRITAPVFFHKVHTLPLVSREVRSGTPVS
jgi:ribosomal protein S18